MTDAPLRVEPVAGALGARIHGVNLALPLPDEAVEAIRSALHEYLVNPMFTVRFESMTTEESAPVLSYLYGHATRPEFTFRFRWAPGTLLVWDNRVVLHNALEDDFGAARNGMGFRRVLHRATLTGERPMQGRPKGSPARPTGRCRPLRCVDSIYAEPPLATAATPPPASTTVKSPP